MAPLILYFALNDMSNIDPERPLVISLASELLIIERALSEEKTNSFEINIFYTYMYSV